MDTNFLRHLEREYANGHNGVVQDVSLDDVGSCEERYYDRIRHFEEDGLSHPHARHATLWVLHNALAHPLLGAFPGQYTVEFHELTSRWLNKTHRFRPAKLPPIHDRKTWFWHNAVVHPLIGFFPSKVTFDMHDASAMKLGVPGWV